MVAGPSGIIRATDAEITTERESRRFYEREPLRRSEPRAAVTSARAAHLPVVYRANRAIAVAIARPPRSAPPGPRPRRCAPPFSPVRKRIVRVSTRSLRSFHKWSRKYTRDEPVYLAISARAQREIAFTAISNERVARK